MKRLLSIMLTAVMLFTLGVGVNAESVTVDPENGAYETQMQVSFSNDNHYTVEIPTSLAEGQEGEIRISNSAIGEGYHVSTYITNLNSNGYIDVENEKGDESEIDIIVDGVSAAMYKMNGKVAVFGEDGARDVSVRRATNAGNSVGTYTGVVCFKFNIEDN